MIFYCSILMGYYVVTNLQTLVQIIHYGQNPVLIILLCIDVFNRILAQGNRILVRNIEQRAQGNRILVSCQPDNMGYQNGDRDWMQRLQRPKDNRIKW